MEPIRLNTIEEAIADFKEGNFVIVVDDEDRENEGDFIIAAEKITPEKVNFMLTHGRGVLCAPITEERCAELELDMQVSSNTSIYETPFTVTVDLLEGCTTGVSMHDRAMTIRALADPKTKPADLGVRDISILCVLALAGYFVVQVIPRQVSIWLSLPDYILPLH